MTIQQEQITKGTRTWEDVLKALRVPFPPDRVKWRQSGGGEVAYVDARDYMNRLDEATLGLWQDKYDLLDSGIAVCSIGLKCGTEWLWRTDGAGQTNIEGEKGGITDAFKRACVKWGLGRYLYYLPKSSNHQLPKWATPEGYLELLEKKEEETE